MHRLVLVALASLTLSASAAAQQQQGKPKPKPKSNAVLVREVQRHVRDYISAYNRADATGLSYAFSRRADVTSVIDGEITRGYDAIRALNDEMAGEDDAAADDYLTAARLTTSVPERRDLESRAARITRDR